MRFWIRVNFAVGFTIAWKPKVLSPLLSTPLFQPFTKYPASVSFSLKR